MIENSLNLNIKNFSGSLDVLLELAKAQKVDLAEISITELADQFHKFIYIKIRDHKFRFSLRIFVDGGMANIFKIETSVA